MRNYWLTKNLKLWIVDDGETHWYSASTSEEALKMHLEPMKHPKTGELCDWIKSEMDEYEVTQMDNDSELEIRLEVWNNLNELLENSIKHSWIESKTIVKVTKTAKNWALEGKGIVATTCYQNDK